MTRPTLYCSERSPFARKVRVVLDELGVEFDTDVLNTLRPVPEFSAVNPALTVPVFEHAGLTLFESNLILEYLLDSFGASAPATAMPPLYPQLRRPSHQWQDGKTLAVLEALGNSIVNISLVTHFDGVQVDTSAYLQRQQSRILSCLDWLEGVASDDGFIPGWCSVLDINFICHIGFAEARGVVELGERPTLQSVRKHFANRPSLESTTPSTD